MNPEEKKQPEVNIGTVGHVDHGKTTLVQSLSGVWADRHSESLRRGITIKLGYADTTFRKCPSCDEPECYTTELTCPIHKIPTKFLRRVSFVDSPGHEILMATMLSGAALMDGAVLVIAANEPCPQPQTFEHFVALGVVGVKNLVIVQNKIEVPTKEKLMENYEQIRNFVANTWAADAPIIPISALHKVNLDILIQTIEKKIPTPKRDPSKPARMHIARSFDVNKPGTLPEELVGGILGGSIMQGVLRIGDEVEITPGVRVERAGKVLYEKLVTEVASLKAGEFETKEARPGGLVGVGTNLDPSLTKGDSLVGSLLGKPGNLPEVWNDLSFEYHLLERVVGIKEGTKIEPLKPKENILVSLGTATSLGIVDTASKDRVHMNLKRPVSSEKGSRAAFGRQFSGRWRLIGYGILT